MTSLTTEKGFGLIAFGLTLALLGLPAPASAQFSIHPANVFFAESASEETAVITLKNQGSAERQIQFYAADFEQHPEGSHDFFPLSEGPSSCAERLSIFPSEAVLLPGEEQSIRITLAPGSETCWSVVFAESLGDVSEGIRVGQRLGVKVYGVPAQATRDASFTAVQVNYDAESPSVRLEMENIGESPLRPEGRVEIRTLDGEVVNTIRVPAFSALPSRSRIIEVPWEERPDLPAGEYIALPILDFGADYLLATQVEFLVP